MAARIADVIAGSQRALTMRTRLGDQINDGIDPLRGNQGTRVPRMSWLTAGVAAALEAATSFALPPGETVRGRRLRGCRRVLLTQRQLPFEIGDLAFAFGERSTQTLDLLSQVRFGVVALLSLGPRHNAHGTPIGSTCTAP